MLRNDLGGRLGDQAGAVPLLGSLAGWGRQFKRRIVFHRRPKQIEKTKPGECVGWALQAQFVNCAAGNSGEKIKKQIEHPTQHFCGQLDSDGKGSAQKAKNGLY